MQKDRPWKVQTLFVAYSANFMFPVTSGGFREEPSLVQGYYFSTNLGTTHFLKSIRTWITGLTLAPEGYGSLATLQPVHGPQCLRSGSHWGCRMSENLRSGSTELFTLCKLYLVLILHYWDTCRKWHCATACQLVEYRTTNISPWLLVEMIT